VDRFGMASGGKDQVPHDGQIGSPQVAIDIRRRNNRDGATQAAEEMHVTHGAVSQRIKRLEEHLGTPLFRRSGRRMLLTDEGSRLLERGRAAISEIAEGVEAIRPGDRDRILTISIAPCFAAGWLLPRLADFNEHHPDIQVNIRATRSHADFTGDGVDMAVRFGGGTWAGLSSIKLYDEELIPVCSPAFLGGRLPRAPDDLLKVPLLHSERQSWSIDGSQAPEPRGRVAPAGFARGSPRGALPP
jgi:LysR family transcriptional regulator, glycine cleavage system transcriptional activator